MNLDLVELNVPRFAFRQEASATVTYAPQPGQRMATEPRWSGGVQTPFAASGLSLRADWDGSSYALALVVIVGNRILKSGELSKITGRASYSPPKRFGSYSDRPLDEMPAWAQGEVADLMEQINDSDNS